MKRYWFEFEDDHIPVGLKLGCGLTAFDYEDAVQILNRKVFKGRVIPIPNKVIEDIDVSTLDALHVLLNMAAPNVRGIWYPLGFN